MKKSVSQLFSKFRLGTTKESPSHEEAPPSQTNSVPEADPVWKQIKNIDVISRRLTSEVTHGEYHSSFHGQGIEFEEVREYTPGDDVRTIDWNVTARSGKTYVKQFVEEKERVIFFVVDVSSSNQVGSISSKLDVARQIISALIFSSSRNNDKIGLLLFDSGAPKIFFPKKGKSHALHLIRELYSSRISSGSTQIEQSLSFLNATLKRSATVVLISDFQFPIPVEKLRVNAKRHDLLAISVFDPLEKQLPDLGVVTLEDPETREVLEVDLVSSKIRKEIESRFAQQRRQVAAIFSKENIDYLSIETSENYATSLRKFFHQRKSRISHFRNNSQRQ